jgi:2-polyprenyl-3-methyl-5-hydroxy-6-metoxy-1,4-benzoquinol methylase
MRIDWTKATDDPKNTAVIKKIEKHLKFIQASVPGGFNGLLELFRDKAVLDVGAAAHDEARYRIQSWKHKRIANVANRCVGVDIIKSMVDIINNDGYDMRLCDATSDEYLGEKFDVVFLGDIIEHVTAMDKLLYFGKRHLNPGGTIIVGTPNPFFINYFLRVCRKKIYVASCEHVAWISESMAFELSRRTGLELISILRPVSKHWLKRSLQELNLGIFSHHYYYIYT